MDQSYQYPFDSLIWISRVQPEDKSFRIFSWQLKLENNLYAYFGVVQLENGRVYPLLETKEALSDEEYSVFTPEEWLGQLYYAIHSYKYKKEKGHILFGFRENERMKTQKIAAPILISGDEVFFGDEIFFKQSRHGAHRIIIEYASVAKASLRYDTELEGIIYDHLTPVLNPYESNEMMLVPDGSYEGYFFDKGVWRHEDKIEFQAWDIPPVEQGRKNRDKKDIMGN
jgi:hypothetical protein